MKQNMLMRKLFGDIRLNRGSVLAVWLTFTLGLTFYGGTYPAGVNFRSAFSHLYDLTHLADLWYELDPAPANVVDEVRAVAGVSAASGRLVYDLGLERDTVQTLTTLRLISFPTSEADVNNLVLQEGKRPTADYEVALMQGFAMAQGIQVGDTLRLTGSADQQPWSVRVVGLVASGEYLIGARGPLQPFPTLSTFGVGYAPYDALAAHMNAGGKVNSVNVILNPSADLNTVRAAITDRLQAADSSLQLVMDRRQFPAYATLKANADSNLQVGLVFSLIFLFGSGAIMAVLLSRQVESERRTIGTLRALGYSRLEVLRYYLAFALIISVVGALAAVPIGYLITSFVIGFFQQGMIGAPVPFASNPPNWSFILFGVGAEMVMALISAALPAWNAANTDPGLALRPPAPGTLSGLARLQVRGLPLAGKQAVRNLLRVPGRTVGTALGTACGLAMIVCCFAVWDTLDYNFAAYYHAHNYDFTVTLGTPTTEQALRDQIGAVRGTTGVETGLIAPIKVQLANRVYTALGIVLDDNRTFTTFETIQGAPAFSSGDGVWLGHNLARALDAKTGDILSVTAQGITKQVKVQGLVKQVLGAPMYVPMSLFSQWMPLGARLVNQAYVRADPSQRSEVQRALNALPNLLGVEDWQSTIRDLTRVTDFNGNFALLFLGFGVFLTFTVLFNSISASLHERRNELVIMRMQGVSMAEIRQMVLWETGLAVFLGLLLGILPTLWLVDYTMQLYNTDVAGNLTVTYPATWLFAIVILIATALISHILPLRGIRAANLGEVSKAVGI